MRLKRRDTVRHGERRGKVLRMSRDSSRAYVKFEQPLSEYPHVKRAWVSVVDLQRVRSKGEPRKHLTGGNRNEKRG